MSRTPQIILSPIGTNRPAIAIPGVSQIRGVLIDNPSGAWLLLRPTNDYIPPYTIGFARSFDGAVATIGVEFPSSGPAGQVTTFQGDPPMIVLDSDPVGNNAGVAGGQAFIQQFTPNNLFYSNYVVPLSVGSDNLVLSAINGKRYRILTAFVALQPFFSSPPINWDSGMTYDLYLATTVTDLATGKLNATHPNAQHLWPQGADCPVGGTNALGVGAVRFFAQPDFADTSVSLTLTYQII